MQFVSLLLHYCIQIVEVHDDLRDVKFVLDPMEEEAGKAILQMLRQSDASEELELETFLQAASKLDLTSPKALLIERRAIRSDEKHSCMPSVLHARICVQKKYCHAYQQGYFDCLYI